MYYVIQENLFKEYHFKTLIEHLNRHKLDYETVEYKPFIHEVRVRTDRKDVMFFGSVNAAMVLMHKDWYPGIFYNEGHDFEVYLSKYGENLLNSDGIILEFGNEAFSKDVFLPRFIRPTRDTKIFESKVWHKDEWEIYIKEATKSGELNNIRNQTKIMVSQPKEIQQEIRCWIIDGIPVTMSQYKIGRRVNMLNMDNNEEAYIFAKDMAKIYSPSRAFVLDICLHNDEYKVVEINCLNMSGFYDGNMSKLIQALENTFGDGENTPTTGVH